VTIIRRSCTIGLGLERGNTCYSRARSRTHITSSTTAVGVITRQPRYLPLLLSVRGSVEGKYGLLNSVDGCIDIEIRRQDG